MSLAVSWAVTVNDKPATDTMNPYIESIECTDKEGGSADTARLTFDDTDGQCMLPPKGSEITIEIEGVVVFEGVTDVPESVGARGSGMQINVDCTGHDKRGKVKERLGLHKDDATLKDFLEAAAKKAGFTVKVDQQLGQTKRPYWSTAGRSFQQLGAELADELGATFKLRGKQAVFAKRGQGGTPGGSTMPTVQAVRGKNLRSWRITPFESAPRFTKALTRHYDRDSAKWLEEEIEIGTAPGSPQAADIGGAAKADKGSAKSRSDGAKTKSEREGGSGDVTIDLDVSAFAEGTGICVIRPGIDGSYRIASRTHRLADFVDFTTASYRYMGASTAATSFSAPLVAAGAIGSSQYFPPQTASITATISGATLSVSALNSGIRIEPGMVPTINGLPCRILDYGTGTGAAGTYTLEYAPGDSATATTYSVGGDYPHPNQVGATKYGAEIANAVIFGVGKAAALQ